MVPIRNTPASGEVEKVGVCFVKMEQEAKNGLSSENLLETLPGQRRSCLHGRFVSCPWCSCASEGFCAFPGFRAVGLR